MGITCHPLQTALPNALHCMQPTRGGAVWTCSAGQGGHGHQQQPHARGGGGWIWGVCGEGGRGGGASRRTHRQGSAPILGRARVVHTAAVGLTTQNHPWRRRWVLCPICADWGRRRGGGHRRKGHFGCFFAFVSPWCFIMAVMPGGGAARCPLGCAWVVCGCALSLTASSASPPPPLPPCPAAGAATNMRASDASQQCRAVPCLCRHSRVQWTRLCASNTAYCCRPAGALCTNQ